MVFTRSLLAGVLRILLVASFHRVSAIPYKEYILAPSSRTIIPASIRSSNGVNNPTTTSGEFSANGTITYDFAKNIGGRITFIVNSVSSSSQRIDFTFTESSQYINSLFCDATQGSGLDSPLSFPVTGAGLYTPPREKFRGGFRYMTVTNTGPGDVSISNLSIEATFEPTMADPSAYTGFFNSNNERLNRVWYAGAYTNQLCIIDPGQGTISPQSTQNWFNNFTVGTGGSVLVDGAKRDRLVWPGDIAVSGPSIYVATANSESIKIGISQLFSEQSSNGRLPYVGTLGLGWSFTYHCHTLIDLYEYYIFTGDQTYVLSLWDKYKLAMAYVVSTIDSSGLAQVTSNADWLRNGMGGHNIEANAIFFRALDTGILLAAVLGDTSVTQNWTIAKSSIQIAANSLLWVPASNLFKDNENSTVLPQDGNSYAVLSGLVNDSARASAISTALAARWVRPYGAPAPEAGATISPFASGFELRAHYAAGHAERAVELMDFMWGGFMLDDPRMTNSSFIEGYSTDGSLHYAPYASDPRVSHAHGWSTAPTSSLTNLGVGLRLTGGAGKTWEVEPQLGGLERATAGFSTSLGFFSASWTEFGFNGIITTPVGTSGSLIIRKISGATSVVLSGDGSKIASKSFDQGSARFEGLTGGNYSVALT